ncbi:hypothetical protein ACFY2Y_15555 [Janibacter hoylei]|uniref:hypothetical protein n=1 Tax=Janibacter hoylei TaxID=364298 RepID=UPI0036BF2457
MSEDGSEVDDSEDEGVAEVLVSVFSCGSVPPLQLARATATAAVRADALRRVR